MNAGLKQGGVWVREGTCHDLRSIALNEDELGVL